MRNSKPQSLFHYLLQIQHPIIIISFSLMDVPLVHRQQRMPQYPQPTLEPLYNDKIMIRDTAGHMKLCKRYPKQILVFTVIAVVLIFVYLRTTTYYKDTELNSAFRSKSYSVWPSYVNNVIAQFNWYKEKCFQGNLDMNIHSLPKNMKAVESSQYAPCRKFLTNFREIYDVSMKVGIVKMPKPFRLKVSKWLQHKKELVKEVERQEILHVQNKYTNEYTAYNALRKKRPRIKPKVDPLEYVSKLVEETQPTCDFCNFRNFTSEDDLGRVESDLTATASNTFKYDSYHQIIFPKHCHNPLDVTREQVVDLFMTAHEWFKKVHRSDRSYRYPIVVWDTFPHGGASQVHPHIQASIDKIGYYGKLEITRKAADAYARDHDGMNNYFTDLKDIHSALGLTCTYGSATALAHLTSHKDYEIVLLSENVNKDIFELLYFVIKAFNEDLGQLSFSFGAVFPDMKNGDKLAKMPVFLRILSRGTVSSMNADISSLELFTLFNVNVDPYIAIDAIRKSIEKRS